MITFLKGYVYQVLDLANMKALMQAAEIKLITVYDVFELSPNIVKALFHTLHPPMQLLVSKLNFEISYWLYLSGSGCLSSTPHPPSRDS